MKEAFDIMGQHPFLTILLVLCIYGVVDRFCSMIENSFRKK